MCLANTDIQVSCGAERVNLQILLCPIYFNGYNESLVSLNSQHSKQQCKGTADWTADPPVVKFNFSITEEAINACSNTMTVGGSAEDTPRPSADSPWGLLSGHGGGGDRSVCRLLHGSVRLHLGNGLFQGPQHRRHHLPRGGDVPVQLPLPAAVPDQQHSDERVSSPGFIVSRVAHLFVDNRDLQLLNR